MKLILIKPFAEFSKEKINKLKKINMLNYRDLNDFINNYQDDGDEKILAFDADYTEWGFANDLLEKISNLKAICLSTTAFDYIDLDYCNKNNIIVTNIPKYAGESVAEYMFFQALSIAKKLPLQLKNSNKQDFSNKFIQYNFNRKKAGIIGLGNNGTQLARLCHGFGMDVYYYNRTPKNNNYTKISLEELFRTCDVIFECLSINEETNMLISDDMINSMKENAIFVSGTGKKLFNSELMLEKVKKEEIYGCGWEESNKNINDYIGNVFVTSEYAWFTKEAVENRLNIWIDCIISIDNNNPINVVRK